MLYWITITDGRLRAIPPGLKNRVTDHSLCHQERQINVPTGTPAAASENRSSLPPGGIITNSISVITHTEPPQRACLSGAAVSTGLQRGEQTSSRWSLHYIKHNSTCLCCLVCVRPWNCCSSTGQNLVCALTDFFFSSQTIMSKFLEAMKNVFLFKNAWHAAAYFLSICLWDCKLFNSVNQLLCSN